MLSITDDNSLKNIYLIQLISFNINKMKFLEHSHFEALNSALNFDAGVYQIVGRFEIFSLFFLFVVVDHYHCFIIY